MGARARTVESNGGAVASPVIRAWRWWTAELAGMLPAALRRGRGSASRVTLRVTLEDDALSLALARPGAGEQALARVPRGEIDGRDTTLSAAFASAVRAQPDATVYLCLPPGHVLEHVVRLPAAAAENLYEVVGFQMHRISPFSTSQVHFEVDVLADQGSRDEIAVRIWIVQRALLDGILLSLGRPALRPAGHVPPDPATGRGFALLLAEPAPAPRTSRLGPLLWSANAVLLVLLAALTLEQQSRDLDTLRAETAAARARAEAVAGLRGQAQALQAQWDALRVRKERGPSATAVVATLSGSLPDSTWLTHLTLRAGKVSVQGQSSEASALIGRIEDVAMFRNTAFQAPVVRNALDGLESFRLGFEIEHETHEDSGIAKPPSQEGPGVVHARRGGGGSVPADRLAAVARAR